MGYDATSHVRRMKVFVTQRLTRRVLSARDMGQVRVLVVPRGVSPGALGLVMVAVLT